MDEISALKAMHNKQRGFRKMCLTVFIIVVVFASIVFVVFPKVLPGVLMQIFMVLVMASVFGLVFLDQVSFFINKKFYKKDILHDYLFTHSHPDDIHKDIELVQELIVTRRQAAQEMKRG